MSDVHRHPYRPARLEQPAYAALRIVAGRTSSSDAAVGTLMRRSSLLADENNPLFHRQMDRLECKADGHHKFWEGTVSGSTLSVRFGRIGTDGQVKAKKLDSPAAAASELEKLIREKLGKGYVRSGRAKKAKATKGAKTTSAKTKEVAVAKAQQAAPRAERMTPEGREFFYTVVKGEWSAKRTFKETTDPDALETRYSIVEGRWNHYALAALDLGMPMPLVQALLAEAALAGSLFVRHCIGPAPAFDQLNAFFSLQLTGDTMATKDFAVFVVEKLCNQTRPFDPQMQALTAALAASIVGDEKAGKSWLARAARLPAKKTPAKWRKTILELAQLCLFGKPTDLTSMMAEVDRETRDAFGGVAYTGRLFFEAYLGRVALAFIARARDRGFAMPKTDPGPSLPMALLAAKARKLPTHPPHVWVDPPADFKKKVLAALKSARRS